MKYVFWTTLGFTFYAYLGYPLLLWIEAKLRPRPVHKQSLEPMVSIVMAVRNEAARLSDKLRNLAKLDYPVERLEIIVVSDGSTDETNQLLLGQRHIRAILRANNQGKAAALNAAIPVATGEIVLFTDVRQEIEPSALRALVSNFADNNVGCVSGELLFREAGNGVRSGVSLYWRLEKAIRKLEAASGSVVGVTGALYAVRRKLVPVIPESTLLDDVYVPLTVSRAGYRVVFEPAARAWDEEPKPGEHEFRRKVRTLTGNYQLVQIAPWLIGRSNPLRFRFISHKLFRLAVPFLLVAMFVASLVLSSDSFFRALAIAQAVFYLSAAVGFLSAKQFRLAAAPASFCLLNAAAAVALFSFIRHRKSPMLLWTGATPNASISCSTKTIQQDVYERDAALNGQGAAISTSGDTT